MNSHRREFLRQAAILTVVSAVPLRRALAASTPADGSGQLDRKYWSDLLQRVAEPVLTNLAENKLKERMPVEAPQSSARDRGQYTHLEALGRTLAGLAPWLELTDKPETESDASRRFADLARRGIANATDPQSPDYMNFNRGGQPLVDAAFLAHAGIRAPRELWQKLDPAVQQRLVSCLKQTRTIKPGMSNWLLFSAMIEAFLASVGEEWFAAPVEIAVGKHEEWYKGDGTYGDGAELHWDYYNSYVIQPMLLDVLETVAKVSNTWSAMLPLVRERAKRYAAVQERLIAPDGSFPPIGRSIPYRCGAFQLLAQMALRNELPGGVKPAQVRGALTAVIKRTLGAPDTFDDQGWLRIGLAGRQPSLAEGYISTGSLYLCTTAFLPLGLPTNHAFWSDAPALWTQQKIWSGQNQPADSALKQGR